MGRRLDTSILDPIRSKDEAQRARKLENIYHVGQDKIWDGRAVLAELQSTHGLAHLQGEKREAVAHVFSGLMWGELAAWKISAQLADRIDDVGAKMATTSQVHDEARHFYVLHDYLTALDGGPRPLDRGTRGLIETVLGAEALPQKIAGMQLFIESIALTMFKAVREAELCPVLGQILLLFERDEARHVGLGVQYLPVLMRDANKLDRVQLDAFQLRILMWALVSLKQNERHLAALGIDPRKVVLAGRRRMVETQQMLTQASGRHFKEIAGPAVMRLFDAARALAFPESKTLPDRVVSAGRALWGNYA